MKKSNSIFNKNYVINELLVKEIKNLNLNIDEFILLVFFINSDNKKLDLQNITSSLPYEESEILSIINSLIEKKLIELSSQKDEKGKFADYIILDGLSNYLEGMLNNKNLANNKDDIFTTFEKEFGRTISAMEYEIINAWLDKGYSKELILAALKEAIYNGVNNLRYIDKILFEWDKKGLKNPKDVENYVQKKGTNKTSNDLFDYNWLDDETE